MDIDTSRVYDHNVFSTIHYLPQKLQKGRASSIDLFLNPSFSRHLAWTFDTTCWHPLRFLPCCYKYIHISN